MQREKGPKNSQLEDGRGAVIMREEERSLVYQKVLFRGKEDACVDVQNGGGGGAGVGGRGNGAESV